MARLAAPKAVIARLHEAGLTASRKALNSALTGRDPEAATLATVRDIVIPGPAGDLAARLYTPDNAPRPGPVMVFFHGGGFVYCDAATHDAFCRRLCDASGVSILSADYRLAPEHPWPAQMEDAEAVVRWALHNAALLLTDGPLILGGDSAGAYLALAVARKINSETPGTVGSTCLIYPLLHLDDAVWSERIRDLRPVGRAAVSMIRTYLASPPPSLLDAAAHGDPPCTLVFGGPTDPVRPDCLTYEEQMRAAGVPVQSRCFAALPHGFINMTHLLPGARKAVRETGLMLAQSLGPA